MLCTHHIHYCSSLDIWCNNFISDTNFTIHRTLGATNNMVPRLQKGAQWQDYKRHNEATKKACVHPKNYEVYLKGYLNPHCHIALITNNSHIQVVSILHVCSSSLPTWSTSNQKFSNRLRERVWIMAMHPQFKHRYRVAPLLLILTLRDLVSFWITTNHLDPSTQEEVYTCDTQKHRAPLIFNYSSWKFSSEMNALDDNHSSGDEHLQMVSFSS